MRYGSILVFLAGEAVAEAIEEQIDHWRGIESQHLAKDQATDDGDAKRTPEFGTCAVAESKRDAT